MTPISTSATSTAPARSRFITVLAWSFIVLGGLSSLVSLLQLYLVYAFTPLQELKVSFASSAEFQSLPLAISFVVMHIELLFSLLLLLSVFSLVTGIGLLQRKNWARLCFIALMLIAIAWNCINLALSYTVMSQLSASSAGLSNLATSVEAIQNIVMLAGVVFNLAFSASFAWLAWRVCRPAIKAEFGLTGGV